MKLAASRIVRRLAIGVLVFLFFVRFLNVNLPAGWLPVLGAAGT